MKYLMPILFLTSLLLQSSSHSSQDLFGDYGSSDYSSPFTPLRVMTPETDKSSPGTPARTESDSSEGTPSNEILGLISGSFGTPPSSQELSQIPTLSVHSQQVAPPPPLARHPSSSEEDLISSSQGLLDSPTPLTPRKRRLAKAMKRLGQSKRTLINLLKAHAKRDPGNSGLFRSLAKEVRDNENSYAVKKTKFLHSLTRAMGDRLAVLPMLAERKDYVLNMKRLKASITSWEEGCRDIVGEIASSAKTLDHQTPALIFARERRKLLPTGAARRALSDITALHASQSQ
jgi:hypothetical protein